MSDKYHTEKHRRRMKHDKIAHKEHVKRREEQDRKDRAKYDAWRADQEIIRKAEARELRALYQRMANLLSFRILTKDPEFYYSWAATKEVYKVMSIFGGFRL